MAYGTAYSSGLNNRYGTWPKDGLQIMFWDNNLGSYPQSGNVLLDLSSNSRTGIMQNFATPATSTSGYYNNSIQYDGNNDYTSFPNSWLGGSTEFTINIIFRRAGSPNSHGSYTTAILSGSSGGSYIRAGNYGAGWSVILNLSGSLSNYNLNTGSGNISNVILNNSSLDFHHITVCVKPGIINTYYNGNLCDQRTLSIGTISTSSFIPSVLGKYESPEAWYGNIPVFMAYSKYLDANQVKQVYNYFSRLY